MVGSWPSYLLHLLWLFAIADCQRLRRASMGSDVGVTSSRANVCKSFCRATGFQGSLADCTCGYNIFNGRRKRSASNSWDNPPGCESFCLSTGWKQRIGTCNCGTYVLAMKRSKPSYEKPKRAAALIHQRVPIIRTISLRHLMDRTKDKNMDEEDEAGNSGEEDDIQSIRLAPPAPFYFPNHLENKEMYSLLWL